MLPHEFIPPRPLKGVDRTDLKGGKILREWRWLSLATSMLWVMADQS